jgi:hypothetical protein
VIGLHAMWRSECPPADRTSNPQQTWHAGPFDMTDTAPTVWTSLAPVMWTLLLKAARQALPLC